MKKLVRLTEGDIRRLVRNSVNRILREGMFDNPLNQTDIDGSDIDMDDEDFTPEVGMNDFDTDYFDSESAWRDDEYDGDYDYQPSASDFEDVPSDEEFNDFDKYGRFIRDYDNTDEFDVDLNDVESDDEIGMVESRRKMDRIISESINKVLNEMHFDHTPLRGSEKSEEKRAAEEEFEREYKKFLERHPKWNGEDPRWIVKQQMKKRNGWRDPRWMK